MVPTTVEVNPPTDCPAGQSHGVVAVTGEVRDQVVGQGIQEVGPVGVQVALQEDHGCPFWDQRSQVSPLPTSRIPSPHQVIS